VPSRPSIAFCKAASADSLAEVSAAIACDNSVALTPSPSIHVWISFNVSKVLEIPSPKIESFKSSA